MPFQIKPNKKETENKTIRFPMPLIQKIENAIQNQDVSFSSFVIQACEYALEKYSTYKTLEKKENDYYHRLLNNLFQYTKEQLSALCGEIPMTLDLFSEILEICVSMEDMDEFFALCDEYPHLSQEHFKSMEKIGEQTELPAISCEIDDVESWNHLCGKIRKKYGPNAI